MTDKIRKLTFIIILSLVISLFPRAKTGKLDAAPTWKFTRSGTASWYSRHSPGVQLRTANNEIFNDKALTGAMWGVAFNQLVKVTNLENGRSITIRINDRGPHERFIRQGRVIDLTKEAFAILSPTQKGLIKVQIELL